MIEAWVLQREDDSASDFSYQVVDDVEAVVLAVVGVDATMSFLPHVIFQCGFISERLLTVQTLQTDQRKENTWLDLF